MKPVLENLREQIRDIGFLVYAYRAPAFEFKWHFHPEYELTYIVQGEGYRLAGNSHADFAAGDLVLLGPNLPHTWVGKPRDGTWVEAVVLQFSQEFADAVCRFPESQALLRLLRKSSLGLAFSGIPAGLPLRFEELRKARGLEKVAQWLSLFAALAEMDPAPLSSPSFRVAARPGYENRIDTVCHYVQAHFTEDIRLRDVADRVHMTESNFCKFFKKTLGTTFSQYLNELRINEACRFLLHSDLSIGQIAFQCGFESLTYFNRVFRRKKNQTPSEWRLQNRV